MGTGEGSVHDVLVVDDNPGDRRFIEEAFRASQLALDVHTANTKDEALDLIRRRGEYEDALEPAAILLDWNLSEKTGEEVVSAAKSGDSDIPVIVMSGSRAEIKDVKSAFSDVEMYMEKPTEPEGYVEPVRSLLESQ